MSIAEEEKKGGGRGQSKPKQGLPLSLTYVDGSDYMINQGKISGFLHRMLPTADKKPFELNTLTQIFGQVDKKGNMISRIKLTQNCMVDMSLKIPQRQEDFKIDRQSVKINPECMYPFAITRGDNIEVFWVPTEIQRNYWVMGLCDIIKQSIRESQLGNYVEPGDRKAKQKKPYKEEEIKAEFVAQQVYMFLKREFALSEHEAKLGFASAAANQDGGSNEEGGGDPVENALEEQKIFDYQTVSSDERYVRGYLYKTAQDTSMMTRDYFYRRYFVLDKQIKLLHVREKPDGKDKHTFHLDTRLLKVDTQLRPFLTSDYAKHFPKDLAKKDFTLPKDNPLPFALFIDSGIMILWAATDIDYDIWTNALTDCQILDVGTEPPKVELGRKSRFVTSLYAGLTNKTASKPRVHSVDIRRLESKGRPAAIESTKKQQQSQLANYESSTLVLNPSRIEGHCKKTAQKLNFKSSQFYLRNYVIDRTTSIMYIFRLGKEKPDLQVNLTEEGNRVIQVDLNLTNKLVVNHKQFFRAELKTDLQTPTDFPFPLIVRLEQNKIMLLWIATETERSIWGKVFNEILLSNSKKKDNVKPQRAQSHTIGSARKEPEAEKLAVPKQETDESNEFITSLYRCIVPLQSSSGMILSSQRNVQARILQQGMVMKTSQTLSVFSKKQHHVRFLQLNVSTQQLKIFEASTMGKPSDTIDFTKTRLVHVEALSNELRPYYELTLGKVGTNKLEVPHDFKYPLAIYQYQKVLECHVLWTQTSTERKQWLDAFKYIKANENPNFDYTIPFHENLVSTSKNSFICAYIDSLLPCNYDKTDKEEIKSDLIEEKPQRMTAVVQKPPSSSAAVVQQSASKPKAKKSASFGNPGGQIDQLAEAPKLRKSNTDLIEEHWAQFKSETAIENLISGNGTFSIQSKCSMGLIRAKKKLFDTNYDPQSVVKCFLVVDFESCIIGIRSVDSSFSAIKTIEATELIKVQNSPSSGGVDSGEQVAAVSGSRINLVLSSKTLEISTNDPNETAMILNELNRAKMIKQGTPSTTVTTAGQKSFSGSGVSLIVPKKAFQPGNFLAKQEELNQPANNQQQSRMVKTRVSAPTAQAVPTIEEQSRKDEAQATTIRGSVTAQDTKINRIKAPSNTDVTSNSPRSSQQQVLKVSRPSRFQREESPPSQHDEDQFSQKNKEQEGNDNNQSSKDVIAVSFEKVKVTSPGGAPVQSPAQVIPLNRIKFSGMSVEPLSPVNHQGAPAPAHIIRKNSFFDEERNGAETHTDSSQQMMMPSNIATAATNANREETFHTDHLNQVPHQQVVTRTAPIDVDFFNSQSAAARTKIFKQNSTEPVKIKLRKKRATEDSLVRNSIQQSIKLNQIVAPDKISFQARQQSFRDAFQNNVAVRGGGGGIDSAAGVVGGGSSGVWAIRPDQIDDQQMTSFEQKIRQVSHTNNFLDNLTQQQEEAEQSQPVNSSEQDLGGSFDYNHTAQEQSQTPKISSNYGGGAGPKKLQIYTDQQSVPVFEGANSNDEGVKAEEPQSYPKQTLAAPRQGRFAATPTYGSKKGQTATAIFQPPPAEDDLSDWDDGDDSDQFNKTGPPLVNVRDRTVSLSNVFNGRVMERPRGGSQQVRKQEQFVDDWD